MTDIEILASAEKCRAALARRGIAYRPATMVLFAMVREGITYREALALWAEYDGNGAVENYHSDMCYHLLMEWVTEPPAQWFELVAEEVMRDAN